MNEIQIIDTLTTEILILKQQTAQNIIEIGKRLIEVKKSLVHGEWGKYLDEKVEFGKSTANNFMRVAKEFSNLQAIGSLPQTKVFALLEVPQEEREEFIKSNPIDTMTTRELQQAIKDRDKAQKEKEDAENNLKIYQMQLNQAKIDSEKLKDDKQTSELKLKAMESALAKEKESSKEEIAKLQSFIGEAKDDGNNEEVERLQASISEIQGDLDSSALKIDELEAELKEKPVDVIETIVEKVPEEIEKELQELRKKVNQSGDSSVIKFKIYYDELQKTFIEQLKLMEEIKKTDAETYEKCKNAILNLTNKMAERL